MKLNFDISYMRMAQQAGDGTGVKAFGKYGFDFFYVGRIYKDQLISCVTQAWPISVKMFS